MAGRIKDRRRIDDYWARKARAENYPARSVYKLMEVDRKFGLFQTGDRALDLGCYPGSWTLYAAERVGPEGRVIGLDRQAPEVSFAGHVQFIQADVLETRPEDLAGQGLFDVVLSDLAPQTTGIKTADQTRSLELAQAALELARALLKPGGKFLFKLFQGPDVEDFFKRLAGDFTTIRRLKPKSSRSFSPEIFGLALGFRRT
ncbi:MAG: RlmE family RNA methyltransferase [Thermodesulfobacteriota bacterium]